MTARHHQIKTHSGWAVKRPFPGIYLWRDAHGAHYVVDHTGTRRLRPSGHPATHARAAGMPVIEIWRAPFRLDHAA